MVTILISPAIRGEALITGEVRIRKRRLIQCGKPKLRRFVKGGAYLRPSAYQRKYGKSVNHEKQNKIYFFHS